MAQAETKKRPPIVVVMGHVDHGKTTLLDYIRKSNVASREAGGITQSIGAYEIEHPSASSGQAAQRITFIDTPGHEAFSKMRVRGARVADIALLIVAADDGVKPQTKEAIQIITEEKMPMIVVINKIDRAGIDVNKIKGELGAAGVYVEGYGGSVSCQPVSAKTGAGVDELLDMIALTAEVEDLSYHPEGPAKGFVLESRLDSRRGPVATVIITDGLLRIGETIQAGEAVGKVRDLQNFLGKPVKEASPSMPVVVLGFETLPAVGSVVSSGVAEKVIAQLVAVKPAEELPEIPRPSSPDQKVIMLILKADVTGSLEALRELVSRLPCPKEVTLRVSDEGVGEVTDGDAKHAVSTGAIIVAFRVKVNKPAENLIKVHDVPVIQSDIIYELLEALGAEVKRYEQRVVRGELEVLAVFGERGPRTHIIGGRVTSGTLANQATVEVQRRGAPIGNAKIVNLQHNRKDVTSIAVGEEGGLLVDAEMAIRVGDHLIIH